MENMKLLSQVARLSISSCRVRCVSSQLRIPARCLSTAAVKDKKPVTSHKLQKINKAMRAYLERAKAHDDFMAQEIADYEIGKRHLANIMGADPDTFSQEDIDRAIEYLLPSGLFDKKARPQMKHPRDIIPPKKAAQFGMEGRPFHYLFYTVNPNFYQVMHDAVNKLEALKHYEDDMLGKGVAAKREDQLVLAGSEWKDKQSIEKMLTEKFSNESYARFVKLMERLAMQPYSYREKDFIMHYRKVHHSQNVAVDIPELIDGDDGRPYMTAEGYRHTAVARVKVIGNGTGLFTVNGLPLLQAFKEVAPREQIMFPLQFTDLLGEVDVEAEVLMGGPTNRAGALRLGLSLALQSFINRDMVEKMRLAGLLTRDPRRRERKKPGQKGARAKFTWKKR